MVFSIESGCLVNLARPSSGVRARAGQLAGLPDE
jgi:hypothetical protein